MRLAVGPQTNRHDPETLIRLFAELFAASEATRLVRGGAEPIYLPVGPERATAQIVFAHGYFASALHEIAHWCVAGPARRSLVDYGYWYKPDGRSQDEQRAFEQVEVKPQALEWIFSQAAGVPFHFSADNLAAGGSEATAAWQLFQQRVASQARSYLRRGLPRRAGLFAARLAACYGAGDRWRQPESYAADGEGTLDPGSVDAASCGAPLPLAARGANGPDA